MYFHGEIREISVVHEMNILCSPVVYIENQDMQDLQY